MYLTIKTALILLFLVIATWEGFTSGIAVLARTRGMPMSQPARLFGFCLLCVGVIAATALLHTVLPILRPDTAPKVLRIILTAFGVEILASVTLFLWFRLRRNRCAPDPEDGDDTYTDEYPGDDY